MKLLEAKKGGIIIFAINKLRITSCVSPLYRRDRKRTQLITGRASKGAKNSNNCDAHDSLADVGIWRCTMANLDLSSWACPSHPYFVYFR